MRVALLEPQAALKNVLAAELASAGLSIVLEPSEADAVVLFVDAMVEGWESRVREAVAASHGALIVTHVGPHAPTLQGVEPLATLRRPFVITRLLEVLSAVDPVPRPRSSVADASYQTVDLVLDEHLPSFDIVTHAFATSAANLLDTWTGLAHAERIDALATYLQRYRAAVSDQLPPRMEVVD